jgi:hypothetical protein
VITSIIKSFFPFKLEKGVNFGIGAAPENVLALSSSSPSSEPIASAPPAVIITTSKEGGEGVVPTAPLASSSSEGEAVLTPTAPPLASNSADEPSENLNPSDPLEHKDDSDPVKEENSVLSASAPLVENEMELIAEQRVGRTSRAQSVDYTPLPASAIDDEEGQVIYPAWMVLPLKTLKPSTVSKKIRVLNTYTICSIQVACSVPHHGTSKAISYACLRLQL